MEKSSVLKGVAAWAKANVLNEIGFTSPLWGVANAFCALASASPDAAASVLAKVRPELALAVDVLASEHFEEIVKAYRESLAEHPLQFKLRTETRLDGTQVYKTFYFRPDNLDKLAEEIGKAEG
jgi:hypothetical protein